MLGSSSSWVYVVDDDVAVRDAIATLLRAEDFNVMSFASGEELLASLDNLSSGCVVMDVRMPGPDGSCVQERLAETRRDLAVILISGDGNISLAVSALKHGATDFFEKPFRPDALVSSIRSALASLIRNSNADRDFARLQLLTVREREILDRLVAGDTSKEIARVFRGSPRTVDVHRARVLKKLGARNVAEAVRIATDARLL